MGPPSIRARLFAPVVRVGVRVNAARGYARTALLGSAPGRAWRSRRGLGVLHCLGDSHVKAFRDLNRRAPDVRHTVFNVHSVRGGTALGLANPGSRTNALRRFTRLVARMPHDDPVLMEMGEVDCGHLAWYRFTTRGIDVGETVERSLAEYERFVRTVLQPEHRRVIIASVPPPTIEDYTTWEGLEGSRRLITSSLQERLDLTNHYNLELAAMARRLGIEYLDFTSDVVDPATGRVRPEFVNPNGLDHHLFTETLAPVLGRHLAALGFE